MQISFVQDDTLRDLLGFKPKVIHEKYTLSDHPVDILSFDKIFRECDVAQGKIFKGRISGSIHNWTKNVDPGYKYKDSFAGGITWHMMKGKDFKSSYCFELKNENNQIVSFDGQSIIFRLSIKYIDFIVNKCQNHY